MTERPKMNKERMLWLDFETTGIEAPPKTTIVEVAAIVTDNNLNELGSMSMLVPQPGFVLQHMEAGARDLHKASGLWDELWKNESKCLGAIQRAEELLAQLISNHNATMAPLCGSTIHYDRAYLNHYMPHIAWPKLVHYRNFDISQTKQTVERWMPWLKVEIAEKKGAHRAFDDIRESLELARRLKAALDSLKIYEESVLPMVLDNGTIYVVDSVSGGADEIDDMPRRLSLCKTLPDGSSILRSYIQTKED